MHQQLRLLLRLHVPEPGQQRLSQARSITDLESSAANLTSRSLRFSCFSAATARRRRSFRASSSPLDSRSCASLRAACALWLNTITSGTFSFSSAVPAEAASAFSSRSWRRPDPEHQRRQPPHIHTRLLVLSAGFALGPAKMKKTEISHSTVARV